MNREGDKYGNAKEKGSGAIFDTGAIGARAARVMKRSKHIQQRAETQLAEKEKLLKDLEYIDPLSMDYQPTHHKTLLTVEELRLGYEKNWLFTPISFSINAGEIVVFTNRIEQMSMGQRKKVEVAKSLSQSAELYIWDEPLNYLDVFNHQQLEALILSVRPAMLVIEHDAHFMKKITDKKIVLKS